MSAAASLGRGLWEIIQILVLALLMVMVIRNFIHNYRIDGISMEPNFHDRQFLIVNRFAYCPGIHIEIPVVNVSALRQDLVRPHAQPGRCRHLPLPPRSIPRFHQARDRAARARRSR